MRTDHVGGRRSASNRARRGGNRFRLEQLERRELLATYTVNATTDTGSGSGLAGDLRYCITQVNKDNTLDTIDFAIGGTETLKTITLASPLPTIINSVFIDGSSQSGYSKTPVIELDGSKLTTLDSVLTVTAGKSTFKALAINGCPGVGITLQGNGLSGDGNTVVGCFIGTSADGTTAKPNGFGIDVYGSSSNTIGGTAAGALNVISGNTSQGISIGDALTSNKNIVLGNHIGTDVAGQVALANGQYGLLLDHTSDNTIGGTADADANVISGNKLDGILVEQSNGASTGNVVSFNKIGTSADGTAAVPNAHNGIHISLATITTITGNVISGNTQDGILVDPGTTGTTIQGNQVGVSQVPTSPGINLAGSFNGLQFNDSANLGTPPDTIAAVGQSHIVETINTVMRVSNKDGSGATTVQLGNLFPNSTATDLFDPVVFYDDIAKRFVVAAMESPVNSSTSFLNIAFSDPSNEINFPSSSIYRINTQEGSNWADFPRFGFNADAVVYSFNMYDTSDRFHGVQILSIDKNSIGSTSLTTDKLDRPNDFTDAPASMHGATPGQPMYFVESSTTFTGAYTDVHVLTWSNPLNTNSQLTDSDITVSLYTDPTSADQKGSSNQIQTNDIRMLSVAWRSKRLIAAHEVDNGTGDPSVRWYDFLTDPTSPASTPTLTQSGTINQGAGVADYFPSIDIDPGGDLGMTFMQSSSSEYMSMYVTGQLAGASAGTMLAPVLARAGVTTYAAFDPPPYRAGDYSGMGIDPSDGSFWSANEYAIAAQSGANFGTWVQQFTIRRSSGTIYIPLGNGGDGVGVAGQSNILIGGTSAAEANIIGANTGNGVFLDSTSSGVLVEGNFIGTDPSSDNVGNKRDGVLSTGNQNTIGGTAQGAGNVISGNANNGIELAVSGQADSTKTLIEGNIIGLIASGLNILGNGNHGIFQNGADNTTIGGTSAGARNVISGNGNDGISMGTGIHSLVEGNYIGTDITGTKALGNRIGLEWTNASFATIGGTAEGAGNVISGNTSAGINSFVIGSGNEVIQGNFIGVNASGTKALPNQGVGMRISGPTNNTIGGTAQGAGNVIAANNGDGIQFTVGPADGTVVEGNFIGTDASGTLNLGNQGTGVVVWSNNVTIGGTANGAGNIIANNTSDGIRLVFDVDNNSFLSNSIYNNGGLGINFGNGPTPNHAWPPGVTSGPNLFQNYPVLGTATSSAGNTTITGTLNAAPNTQFLVQFFASPTADPSGYGQGQIYLGSTMVTTDGTSNAAINATLSGVSVPGGYAVTATATDPLGNTSEFAKDVSIQNVADLGITGQISESPAYIGDTVTYTFTITNAGPDTGHGVTFTDTLPAGVNYADGFSSVPAGITPIIDGNSITVNVGTLAAGATVILIFQAQITTGAASSITNTGSVTTTDFDPTTPDTAPVVTTVLPSADLAITQLTATAAPNYVGANLVYTIAAANNGPSDATGVMVVDTLPANVVFISATGGATFDGTNKVTLNAGSLAAGGMVSFTITVQPTAAAVAASPISDSATASANEHDSDTSNDTLTVPTTIVASADLQVGISPSASPVDAGQNLTYTITATNNGPSDATGVVVTDTIPADVTFVSATGAATPDGTGKITFSGFALAAHTSASFMVIVTALGSSASPTSDSATVSAIEHDPSTANNTISVSVPVTPISDLAVGLTATASAYVGNQVTYTITAANTGPSTEPAAVVTDTLPANVTFQSATGGVKPDGSGKLTFNLGSLASGATPVTLTILVVAQPAAAGTIMNTASITGQNVDHTVGNKTSTKSTTITPSADLAVGVTASSSSLLVDQNLVYTITATNKGPSNATGVTVVDTLPATPKDVRFISATGGMTPDSNNKVTFNVGNLASGATVTYTVIVQPTVTAPTDSPLSNSATITGNEHDPNTGNDTSQLSTAVLPAVDLAVVTFTASPGTLEIGHQLTYKTIVTNHGPSPATGVTLSSPLGGGVSFVSASATQGSVGLQGSSVVASLNDLAAGASATVTFVVVPNNFGSLTAQANVTSNETDTDPSNNSASTTTTVLDRPGTIEFAASSYVVAENAGWATLTVNRVLGARGTVTVDYTTELMSAIPGLDYTPVSGTLVFPAGVLSETIKVPVLANPYDHQNELVNIVLSNVTPAGDAFLGSPSTATLTIQDIDPNFSPLSVTNLQWSGTTQNISQIFVTFNKPLITSTATNPANYSLVNVGADGKFGTADDQSVAMAAPVYQSSSFTVVLTPTQALPANRFFHLLINGAAPGAVEDVVKEALAGDGVNAGTNYTALLARGTSLRYFGPTGDTVSLQIKGGGIIDDLLDGSGRGTRLTVAGEVPHRTVLTGSVKRAPGSSGRDSIGPTIYGLGQFGDVRVRMYSPPFLVGQYPFMPGSSTGPTVLSPARAAKAVAKTTSRKTSRPAVQAAATGIATRTGQTGAAILAPSSSIGKSMHCPFHSFR